MEKPPKSDLRDRALRLLARREHTSAELVRKLSALTSEQESVGTLVKELTQAGLLSDARYAEHYLTAKRGRFGGIKIVHDLKSKGVDADTVAQITATMKETELDAARNVWQKKFGSQPVSATEKAKQIRFLQGRGFSADAIHKLFKFSE